MMDRPSHSPTCGRYPVLWITLASHLADPGGRGGTAKGHRRPGPTALRAAGEVEIDIVARTEDELEQKTREAIAEAYRTPEEFDLRWVFTVDPAHAPDPAPPGETDNPIN
ncbi:MAG: hypothetical protein IRZ05_04810 [Micromonosporaceae bacterium]|nr:hypothetical protein [Micromonosporaceae bacterium]